MRRVIYGRGRFRPRKRFKFMLDKVIGIAYNPFTEKPFSGRAQVAQSVEQTIENRRVAGSIPALGTIPSPLRSEGLI